MWKRLIGCGLCMVVMALSAAQKLNDAVEFMKVHKTAVPVAAVTS